MPCLDVYCNLSAIFSSTSTSRDRHVLVHSRAYFQKELFDLCFFSGCTSEVSILADLARGKPFCSHDLVQKIKMIRFCLSEIDVPFLARYEKYSDQIYRSFVLFFVSQLFGVHIRFKRSTVSHLRVIQSIGTRELATRRS